MFVPLSCTCSAPYSLVFCHHTFQKRIFFCVCVYLFVSILKELVRRERVQRVPYLGITSNNHIWTLGKALDGSEELWGCSGPSGDWNIEECKWNWATRWGFPLLFLPEGAKVSISWPAYQSYSLDTCPRLCQGILFKLKAAVQVQSAVAHCKPVLPMAWSFLPGFGSWLSGPCDIYIYIDNCYVSGTEYTGGSNLPMHLLFSVNHGWVMKHTLLGLDLFTIFFSPLWAVLMLQCRG